MPAVWQNIEDLDNVVPASTQNFMLLEGRKLVERASRWLLRNRPQSIDIASNVDYFTPGIKKLCTKLPSLLADSTIKAIQDKVTELTSQQVPEKLAQSMSMFGQLLSTLDIVEVANGLDLSVEQVASVYYALGEKLELPWLHLQIVNLPRHDRWQALSRAALRDDLYNQHRQLTRDVLLLTDSKQEDAGQRVEQWMSMNTASILRSRQILADLKTTGKADFAMLPVAMREIRGMSTINASQATAALDVGKTDKKAPRPKSGSNKKAKVK
jgi:glutamate dehydrogenase